jgi:hypothetical protein
LSKILPKLTLVRFAVIYLPIIVGLIFSATGLSYFLETSQTYPIEILPKYGIINLASQEFSAEELTLVIDSISEQGNYVEAILSLNLDAKIKEVQSFGLQVPHRVENAFFKVGYKDVTGNIVFDQGDGEVIWRPESEVSILTYSFRPQSGSSWFSVEVHFRWFNTVTRKGFSSYELLIPFSRSDNFIVGTAAGSNMLRNKVIVSLRVNLSVDSRIIDSIPPPNEEVISWQNSDSGIRSLVFMDEVDFGMTPGYPDLPSFRVSYEVPELRERYDRLVFNSGLFLGIGIQFLLAGIFDAIKLRDNK